MRNSKHLFLLLTLTSLAAFGASGLLVAARTAKPAVIASQASGKLAPWVLAHTANGQTAEFFVLLADQADLASVAVITNRNARAQAVATRLREHAQRTQAPLLEWLRANDLPHQLFTLVNAVLVKGTRAVAEALAARPDVARLEGNPAIRNPAPLRPTAAELAQLTAPTAIEPGLSVIRAPEVWNLGYKGAGLVIGSVDSGAEWTHPALINQYRGLSEGNDFNWCDTVGGVSCNASSFEPIDDHGHGTHVLGTALGYDGGANQIGVAPDAKLMACRAMDANLIGTPSSYLKCLEWMLTPYPIGGTPAQGNVTKRPDIVLAAWTCPPSEGCAASTLSTAVTNLRNASIAVVAMAGSNGPACSTVLDPPGIYDAAYTVGAVNSLNTANIVPAPFSSRGPVTVDGSNRLKPDLVAPGVAVKSARAGGGYVEYSGTSMAAAHVAGAIALLWSAQPSLRGNLNQTENLLNSAAVGMPTAECTGSVATPNNVTGFGRLDIKQAVVLAGSARAVKDDFDGDSKTDYSFWRGTDTYWYILKSGSNHQQMTPVSWGTSNAPYLDQAVPGDYDGDGKYDAAVWRPPTGV
jgi:serine protease AprX